jgi:hypothetical protein
MLLILCPFFAALGTTVLSSIKFLNSKPIFIPSGVPPENGDPEGVFTIPTEQIIENYNKRLKNEYDKVVTKARHEFFQLLYVGLVLGLVIALYFVGSITESITSIARIFALCILLGYQAPKLWQWQERVVEDAVKSKISGLITPNKKD